MVDPAVGQEVALRRCEHRREDLIFEHKHAERDHHRNQNNAHQHASQLVEMVPETHLRLRVICVGGHVAANCISGQLIFAHRCFLLVL